MPQRECGSAPVIWAPKAWSIPHRWMFAGFYPGIHLLPDGTIVATSYTTCRKDDGSCCIVSVRFKMSEIDALAAKPAN